MPPKFRLSAKSYLLTYSQINDAALQRFLQPTALLDHIQSTFGPPTLYRLARERHKDGGNHFHVVISWEDRISSRDATCFDFETHHPNIRPIRGSLSRPLNYAGKDNDIIHELGNIEGTITQPKTTQAEVYAAALAATGKDEFLRILRTTAPKDYVLFHERILDFADRHYTTPPTPYISPNFTPNLPSSLTNWLNQSGIGPRERTAGRPRSLILHGDTRTGKTVWARSLGKRHSI